MVATIWSTRGCVWCDRAKDLLTSESIPYTEKVIGVNTTKEELLSIAPGVTSVPQIFIDGVYIGGYQALREHLGKKT
jgi:glutaredoxin